MFVIKHTSGKFLFIQFCDLTHNSSFIKLVDNEFPCFKTEKLARDYIALGDEVSYGYTEDIKITDLSIVPLKEAV